MSGINNAMNNALSGLEAFESGISTVSNNIANANTPGYAVESTNIQTEVAGAGQFGAGVQPAQVSRAASGFAAAQLRNANTANSAASELATSLASISNSLTNNGDVQNSINQFFSDISSLSANPSSSALRQTVLSDGQSVSASFQSASTNINTTITGAQEGLSTGVTAVNNLLSQLNGINQSLTKTPNSASLLDEQQEALNSLSNYMPVNALPQSNGVVVVASGGTVLLDQSGVQGLATETNSTGKTFIVAGTNKAPLNLSEADGSLGGMLGTITAGTQALQSLGTLAAVFSTQVNQSQAQGLDMSGQEGKSLFQVPSPSVTPSTTNTGNAQITASISNSADLPSDGGPFTLSYNNGQWNAVDQTTNQNYSVSGVPPQFAGLALTIAGTAKNGDSFTVNPAPNAASGIESSSISASQIAAADPYVATLGTVGADGAVTNQNAGTITFGTDSVVNTPASGAAQVPGTDFGNNLVVTFNSSSTYTITSPNDPKLSVQGSLTNNNGVISVAYPASSQAAGQYWQLPISGRPVAGDVVTLEPGKSSSGSNAQRMAALWTAPNTTSSGTLQQSAVSLSTGLGANATAATQLASDTTSQVSTATTNLSTVAGVNSDQQAVILSNYEQAYQAAAQVISTAHSMFESLISAI